MYSLLALADTIPPEVVLLVSLDNNGEIVAKQTRHPRGCLSKARYLAACGDHCNPPGDVVIIWASGMMRRVRNLGDGATT
jgi:hypothetical protein